MNHALLPIVALAVAATSAGPAAGTESVRFATFNASMNRGVEGEQGGNPYDLDRIGRP